MMRQLTTMAMIFCVTGTVGCMVEVDDCEGDECSAVSSIAEPLIGGWASGPYTWSQGWGYTKLPSVADTVCVLTRVTGKFAGGGEVVNLWDDGANWYLGGHSLQHGVSAEAYCFSRAAFVGGRATTGSRGVEAFAWTRAVSRDTPGHCGGGSANMSSSGFFSFLAGIQGRFQGRAESARVTQALAPGLNSMISVEGCGGGQTQHFYARGRSVRVGRPELALFSDSHGNRGDASSVPETFLSADRSSAVVVLAPTSEAMCALTSLHGGFHGGGEFVQIRPEPKRGGEHWVLRVSSLAGYPQAGARCFARNQTPL